MSTIVHKSNKRIEDRGEYCVISPIDVEQQITPLCCPICDAAMKTCDDVIAYRDSGCCDRCAMLWAIPKRDLWKNGWRPGRGEVNAANEARLPISITLDAD